MSENTKRSDALVLTKVMTVQKYQNLLPVNDNSHIHYSYKRYSLIRSLELKEIKSLQRYTNAPKESIQRTN